MKGLWESIVFFFQLFLAKLRDAKNRSMPLPWTCAGYCCGHGETKSFFPSLLPTVVIAFWWKSRLGHWWSWWHGWNPSAPPPGKREHGEDPAGGPWLSERGLWRQCLGIAIRRRHAFGPKPYNSPFAHFVLCVCCSEAYCLLSVGRD